MPKLTEKQVLEIAKKYCAEHLKKLDLDKQVKKIKFYEMYNYTRTYAEAAWEIYIKIDLDGCEGLERILVVVSDDDARVEYWEDNNGMKYFE